MRTPQAEADLRRRDRQFQVRLPVELSAQVRLFMKDHNLNENQALKHIISYFFSKPSCLTSPQQETSGETQNSKQSTDPQLPHFL